MHVLSVTMILTLKRLWVSVILKKVLEMLHTYLNLVRNVLFWVLGRLISNKNKINTLQATTQLKRAVQLKKFKAIRATIL